MAVYEDDYVDVGSPGTDFVRHFKLEEQAIYGSSRVGNYESATDAVTVTFNSSGYSSGIFSDLSSVVQDDATETDMLHKKRKLQKKKYELTNHLGNVLAVVSDKKIPVDNIEYIAGSTYSHNSATNDYSYVATGGSWQQDFGSDDVIDYYLPDVVSYSEYYSFGSYMVGRNGTTSNYRYGFNGMEKDDELKGAGNSYDFGARIYDNRLGKFLSMDPISAFRPHSTPYSFAGNIPIWCGDNDGLVPITRTIVINGSRYKVKLDNERPQEFTILKRGIWGIYYRKKTYNFKSTENGRQSLAIMEPQHSKKVSRFTTSGDPQKMEEKYDGMDITFVVREILRHNTDIRLAIIGNHDVNTKDERIEKQNRYLKLYPLNHLYLDCDDENDPDCIAVTEDERVDGRGEKTGDDLEADWTKQRADFVGQWYYNNHSKVDTYSMRDVRRDQFPGITLTPWQGDAVGITITFDFRNTTPDPEPTDDDDDEGNAKYKTVRFL